MPEKIRVDEDRGIIHVLSYGLVTKEEITESVTKINQIFDKEMINKILVDTTRQETMPSTIGIFDIFSTFSQEYKLAMLIRESQATAADISFVETVVLNRGVQVKIFYEKKQALQWLDNG